MIVYDILPSMSKFERIGVGILFATTFCTVSTEIVAHSSKLQFEPIEKLILVNINGEPYSGTGIALKDSQTGMEKLLNLGDRKSSNQYAGSLSPDKSKIAFITESFPKGAGYVVFFISSADVSGSNSTNLTDFEFSGSASTPIWLDNETIAYRGHGFRNTNTYNMMQSLNQNGLLTIKTDNSTRYQLDYTFDNFKDILTFCFDRKNNLIFFVGAKESGFEIYTMNPDGTNPQKIMTLDPNLVNFGAYNMEYLENNTISLDLTPQGLTEKYILNPNNLDLQPLK